MDKYSYFRTFACFSFHNSLPACEGTWRAMDSTLTAVFSLGWSYRR